MERPISSLKTCFNPSGTDYIPILDIDGGVGGKPKTKKISLSTVAGFLTQTVTGIVRADIQAITQNFLGFNESEDVVFEIAKTFILTKVESNIPGRIRLYTSSISRDADRDRDFQTDALEDTGIFFEGIFAPDLLSFPITPLEIVAIDSILCNAIFDSRSSIPKKGILTFTYLPIEV